MGSFVEHNRTTTTSTVYVLFVVLACFFSLSSSSSSSSAASYFLFFFSSSLPLTPSSYQRNNISFMATFERAKINNIHESDSLVFFFENFDASVVFFFFSLSLVLVCSPVLYSILYVCFAKQQNKEI